jgi:hypothetical protein
LAPAKHRFGTIQTQRLDADLHLALSWWWNFDLFNPEHFGAANLVKSHHTSHVSHLSGNLSEDDSPAL